MKNKTIKFVGIGAAILFLFAALLPIDASASRAILKVTQTRILGGFIETFYYDDGWATSWYWTSPSGGEDRIIDRQVWRWDIPSSESNEVGLI
jgi:hypothetical protein